MVFQLKPTASDDAKQGIVDGLLSLKESCAEWVKTEAVGNLIPIIKLLSFCFNVYSLVVRCVLRTPTDLSCDPVVCQLNYVF